MDGGLHGTQTSEPASRLADSQIIVAFVVFSHDVSQDFFRFNVISPTKASVTPGRSSKLVTL